MNQVAAIYNHGRWVAICPRCAAEGKVAAVEVEPGQVFVCPEEHPNLLAMTYIPNPRKAGAFDAVPDEELRAETFEKAVADGDGCEVVFPRNWEEIVKTLSGRPRAARNWTPETTVDELKAENAEHEIGE